MKRPGHCHICGSECREIVSKHTKGKLKGEPIQFGDWHENAWRRTFELSDGSTCDITFCRDCVDDADYGKIWDIVKERTLWEEDHRELRGAPARTAPEKHRAEQEIERIFDLKIEREVGRRMWKFVDHKFGHLV